MLRHHASSQKWQEASRLQQHLTEHRALVALEPQEFWDVQAQEEQRVKLQRVEQ